MAITDLKVLVIEAHDFWFIFGGDSIESNEIISKLLHLTDIRKSTAYKAIQK